MTPFRRYVLVNGRRVHFRCAGQGPPLVMLHGSPGDSAMLEPVLAIASRSFTCIALDTPGFGRSDPLPGDVLTVADLADATAAAMTTLRLPPCSVYGTHTGAAIGIELAVRWPGHVTGVVLEGLPVFTDAEIALLFDGYFAPMVPSALGGHLTETWIRFRDQFTWFPWTARTPARLNPVDRPSADDIDHWVSMFYRSCRTYRPAYRAAANYGMRAVEAAAALTTPAVFMASAEDMLFPHLDRLPAQKPGQRIERLPYDPPAKHAAIAAFVASLPMAPAGAPLAPIRPVGHAPAVQLVDTGDGQINVRCYGESSDSALLLLHDAPGSGLALHALAMRLSADRRVLVPDLPGCGDSDAPPAGRSVLDAGADAVIAIADAFGIDRIDVAAFGCGVAVAAVLATRDDPRVGSIAVDRIDRPDEAVASAIAVDLDPTPEGSHWLKAWLMVRDAQIYRPWFDGRVASQLRTQGNFDATWLHDQTCALMNSRGTYDRLPREAFRFDSAAALSRSRIAIHRCPDGDLAAWLLRTNDTMETE